MGKNYQNTYFRPAVLAAVDETAKAAKAVGISGHALALRWTIYHSALGPQYGDSVIIGASSLTQLQANLDAVEAGPLDEHLAGLVDQVGKLVGDEAAPYHL
ncbi:hypothetical protein BDV38DRAFT_246261 [Aspergillus pseudotamarii]|uniref:NADP-dependent oxidoreductase domain-containing protein n=1 Tax=Aspergillus pseudotamarii TaxID=132259 RepID=A0A5N6ST02_ASPPS|nr:uncharacterized protein BDV38DRAFT_246261 [Aspergillus pseudotamarii]KAE8137816.1 hypothetical protein BDV38DRAFT_246261 [Aspergillus pseudotamarii]